MKEKIWLLEISSASGDYDMVAGLLAARASFGWEEDALPDGGALFRVYCENGEFLDSLGQMAREVSGNAGICLRQVENRDWQSAWKQFFTPVPCGSRFVIVPPWLAGQEFSQPHKLVIEPGSAFGTGHHATTTLCLKALDRLLDEQEIGAGKTFLDLGCGTGILGLAASRCGLTGAGVDTDPLAIENAMKNRALNGAENLELAVGSVQWAAGRTFDVIMANILAGPLMEMAPEITGALRPGGALILSGILDSQARAVAEAYAACRPGEPEYMSDGEWRALVWRGAK